MVSGSDTHQAVQYGCVWTEFQRDCSTAAELLQEMQAGRYTITVSESAAEKVKTASLLKRALKEIHALGGDYVAVLTGPEKDQEHGPSYAERIAVHHKAWWWNTPPRPEPWRRRWRLLPTRWPYRAGSWCPPR